MVKSMVKGAILASCLRRYRPIERPKPCPASSALYNISKPTPSTQLISPPMAAAVILAPARAASDLASRKSVFLAGTTNPTGEADWRETLTAAFNELPIVIFNPKRNDWDSTWKEDFSDSRWAEQVNWELEMQDKADVVVVFFHQATQAPISLLELGLCVRSGKAIVCAQDGYFKRGNVEAVCRRYGATFVNSETDLRDAVRGRLQQLVAE